MTDNTAPDSDTFVTSQSIIKALVEIGALVHHTEDALIADYFKSSGWNVDVYSNAHDSHDTTIVYRISKSG